ARGEIIVRRTQNAFPPPQYRRELHHKLLLRRKRLRFLLCCYDAVCALKNEQREQSQNQKAKQRAFLCEIYKCVCQKQRPYQNGTGQIIKALFIKQECEH